MSSAGMDFNHELRLAHISRNFRSDESQGVRGSAVESLREMPAGPEVARLGGCPRIDVVVRESGFEAIFSIK